jgi:hypothetical protein
VEKAEKRDLSFYRGREAAVATKHGKEDVSGPPMAPLGLHLRVPRDLDTDALGTFTGEVPRVGTPLEVALRKARMGMRATGLPLGLANEGSFGPHPEVPFLAGDHEILLFIDDALGIQVYEETFTSETNFAHCTVARGDDLDDFLRRVHFPGHGLIVRPNSPPQPSELLFKGITTWPDLVAAVGRCARASSDGCAHVETDMRAHMNPTRQRVIATLADRLARRLTTRCPSCGTPGWGRVGVVRGLPCEVCGSETDWVREEIHGCPRCPLRRTEPRSDGLHAANPAHCPWCNP